MIVFWMITVSLPIFRGIAGGPVPGNEDRFVFSDHRREPEDLDYRTQGRQNSEGGYNIENVFKIPIAVIKGTSAAVQAFYPQSTDTINKIFDIPVVTLDAVGNYIKERPQRLGTSVDNDRVEQRPLGFDRQRAERRQDERRERITRLREQERLEREQRRQMEEERILHGGHSSFGLEDFASALTDLFGVGGHGHHHGHHHGHGHQGIFGNLHKPPLKPTKPTKPHKPHKPHRPGHHDENEDSLTSGNGGYEVHEEIDESPIHSSGIFSWLQTAAQSDYPKIRNKIAPGFDFQDDRDNGEFRGY